MPIWYHGYVGGDAPKQEPYDPERKRKSLRDQAKRPRCRCVETGTEYASLTEAAKDCYMSVDSVRRALDLNITLDGRSFEWCEGMELPPKHEARPRKTRRCRRMDTGEVFDSVKELAESLGAPAKTVSSALCSGCKCRDVEIRYEEER